MRGTVAQGLQMTVLSALRRVLELTRYRGWRLVEALRPWLVPAQPFVAQVEGHRMLLDPHEAYNWRLFKWGMAYAEEYRPFCAMVRPGMTVVDAGANVGVFTLAAARRVGPQGKVIAFDPLPRNYRYVVANTVLNGYGNVVVEQQAVGDRDGEMEINLFGGDNVSVSDEVTGGDGKEPITVPCCRLDTYLREHGVERVDVVKVDVEGAEGAVLEGMTETLKAQKPAVIMEVHPDFLQSVSGSPREVLGRLQALGYRIWHLEGGGRSVAVEDVAAFPVPYDPARRPLNCFRVMALPEESRVFRPSTPGVQS